MTSFPPTSRTSLSDRAADKTARRVEFLCAGLPIVNGDRESFVLNDHALPPGQARLQDREPLLYATPHGCPVWRWFSPMITHDSTHLDVPKPAERHRILLDL